MNKKKRKTLMDLKIVSRLFAAESFSSAVLFADQNGC